MLPKRTKGKKCLHPEESLNASHCGEQGRLPGRGGPEGWIRFGPREMEERILVEETACTSTWRWERSGPVWEQQVVQFALYFEDKKRKRQVGCPYTQDCERSGVYPSVVERNTGPSFWSLLLNWKEAQEPFLLLPFSPTVSAGMCVC